MGMKPKSAAERAFNAQVGARIGALRKKAGISQVGLARRIGIEAGLLYHYETGYCGCPLYRLRLIARVLGIDIDQLTLKIE